jgi:hypothetical protein
MVKVSGYQQRQSKAGEQYYALELQSDELEFVISQTTGRPYASVKRCWMSCTFNEEVCKMLIGKTMQGSIKKVECEPYTFTVEETGETLTRAYRFEYQPAEESPEEAVFNSELNKELA